MSRRTAKLPSAGCLLISTPQIRNEAQTCIGLIYTKEVIPEVLAAAQIARAA